MIKQIYKFRYFFYTIIITVLSAYLILLTYGYKINWQSYKIQKTSIIYLESEPVDANVYLNGEFLANSTPIKVNEVFSGRYDVRLTHPLYEDWNKTYFVEPDYISKDSDIVMILKNRKQIEVTENEKEMYKTQIERHTSNPLVIKNENEIFFEDIFVTRFSKKIINAVLYTDKKHIIYQISDGIYFMDSDGTNIIKLVDLNTEEKIMITTSDDGKYLVFDDGKSMQKVQITNSINQITKRLLNRAIKIIQ